MANEIVKEIIKVTTTGGAGSATGSSSSKVLKGLLWDVYVDYHASAPATTDLTISFADRGGNILVLTDINTDGLYAPRMNTHNNAGVSQGANDCFLLEGIVTVSLAGCNALTDAVTVYLRILGD